MATQQQLDQEDKDFEEQFAEEDAAAAVQDEDAAFGISPEVSADDGSGEGTAPVTPVAPTVEPDADPAAVTAPPSDAGGEMAGEPVAVEPEKSQQEKSWEGRLKAREEAVKAREEALAAAATAEESTPEESSEETGAGTMDADGGMSAEDAIQKLTDDFGSEFVQMIVAISKGAAAEVAESSVGAVHGNVEEIIKHLKDKAQETHFNDIYQAHPDFMEISAAPEFAMFIADAPEDVQAENNRIIASGTSREINGLLQQFKDHNAKKGDKESIHEGDDAEGVRSGGIRLPAEPGMASDFAAAWNEE